MWQIIMKQHQFLHLYFNWLQKASIKHTKDVHFPIQNVVIINHSSSIKNTLIRMNK